MKKRWSILSAALCVALLTGGCGTGSKNDAGTDKKPTFSHETREENEHQSSLDVLQPSAYGNVQGLDLEKGSSYRLTDGMVHRVGIPGNHASCQKDNQKIRSYLLG